MVDYKLNEKLGNKNWKNLKLSHVYIILPSIHNECIKYKLHAA
jgi:hypothetical protein